MYKYILTFVHFLWKKNNKADMDLKKKKKSRLAYVEIWRLRQPWINSLFTFFSGQVKKVGPFLKLFFVKISKIMLFKLILCIKWLRKSILSSYGDDIVNPFSSTFTSVTIFKLSLLTR